MASFGGGDNCTVCSKRVYVTERVNIGDVKSGTKWVHKTCLKCSSCAMTLSTDTYGSYEGAIFCKKHLREKFSSGSNSSASAKPTSAQASSFNAKVEKDYCPACEKVVYLNEKITVDDKLVKKTYHKTCFRCSHCNRILNLEDYQSLDGTLFCKTHFRELYHSKGKLDFAAESRLRSSSVSGRASLTPSASLQNLEKVASQDTAQTTQPASEVTTTPSKTVPSKSGSFVDTTPNPKFESNVDGDKAMDSWSKKFNKFIKSDSETNQASPAKPSPSSENVKVEAHVEVKKEEPKKEEHKPNDKLIAEIHTGASLSPATTDDKSAPKLPAPGNTPTDVRHVMEELEKNQGKGLKSVDHTRDASAPKIEADVQIKKSDAKKDLNQEIHKGTTLDHVETKDKAAPVIDPNVHIKTNDRSEFLGEVKDGVSLSPVENSKDASAPKLPTATKASDVRHVMEELEKDQGKHLKSPSEVHDTSAPKIDANVHISKNETRKELAAEIQKGVTLEHATTDDKSAPVIDASAHIEQNNHKELKAEITSGQTTLAHVASNEVHDASAPKLPTATKHETVQQAMKEIAENKPELNHPPVVSDRSAPVIDANVHIKTVDKEPHLKEIQKGVELSHAETKDTSAPVIDANVHIQSSKKPELNKEIEAQAKVEVKAEVTIEATNEAPSEVNVEASTEATEATTEEAATEEPEKEEPVEEKKADKKKKKSKKSKKSKR